MNVFYKNAMLTVIRSFAKLNVFCVLRVIFLHSHYLFEKRDPQLCRDRY